MSYVTAVPKVELHVHFVGAIRPATLLQLARRHRIELPVSSEAEIHSWTHFPDFQQFMQIYGLACECLRASEDFELVTYEFAQTMASQAVRYAEITFTPSAHHQRGLRDDLFLAGIDAGRQRARRELGVEIAWIFDIVRSLESGVRDRYAEHALELAIEMAQAGVVALGLAGSEQGFPAKQFARYFDRARSSGLHSVPHAGEFDGPDSVRSAIEVLGAERIAHGVRAVEDPELLRALAQKRIALDICPTSNVRLGVYPSMAHHPVGHLTDAGVTVTINTDDPLLFGTSLTEEFARTAAVAGWSVADLEQVVLNGVASSFMAPELKRELEEEVRRARPGGPT